MEAHFKLDGCHTLRISTDVARTSNTHGSVGFQVEYEPLRLPGDPEPEPSSGYGGCSSDLPTRPGVRILMSKTLRPSEARAIASMFLSAATEGRA
jgi:hypothetical protein